MKYTIFGVTHVHQNAEFLAKRYTSYKVLRTAGTYLEVFDCNTSGCREEEELIEEVKNSLHFCFDEEQDSISIDETIALVEVTIGHRLQNYVFSLESNTLVDRPGDDVNLFEYK